MDIEPLIVPEVARRRDVNRGTPPYPISATSKPSSEEIKFDKFRFQKREAEVYFSKIK